MGKEFWDGLREQHKDSSDEVKAEIEAAAAQAEKTVAPPLQSIVSTRYTPPSQRVKDTEGDAEKTVAPPLQSIVATRYSKPSQRK